ncbi:MAG: DUF3552 domain-containing protein, partial [Elusimicrobia bacterium]|nr:DUF3552 domain-containing protein [Elusimicrobiota bacterium]
MEMVLIPGCIAIGLIVGFVLRYVFAKFDANSVEQRADNIINEAKVKGDAKAKEIIMEARDNAERERKEAEKEIREKKSEIQNTEKRLNQREDNLDRKMDSLDKKEKDLQQKERNIDNREKIIEQKIAEVDQIKNEQKTILEKLSGLTREEAKERLVKEMV